jgi:isoamylase
VDWHQPFGRVLGMFVAGDAFEEHDERGRRIQDSDLMLLFNAHHAAIEFRLPAEPSTPAGRC